MTKVKSGRPVEEEEDSESFGGEEPGRPEGTAENVKSPQGSTGEMAGTAMFLLFFPLLFLEFHPAMILLIVLFCAITFPHFPRLPRAPERDSRPTANGWIGWMMNQ